MITPKTVPSSVQMPSSRRALSPIRFHPSAAQWEKPYLFPAKEIFVGTIFLLDILVSLKHISMEEGE